MLILMLACGEEVKDGSTPEMTAVCEEPQDFL